MVYGPYHLHGNMVFLDKHKLTITANAMKSLILH